MQSLEEKVKKTVDDDEFWKDCTEMFSAPAGHRVLQTLVAICHPLLSPARATPEETHIQIGRQEVVALLFRRSQPTITPQDIPHGPPQ